MKKDFDLFIAERQKTAPSFTAFGKEYFLPPTIPYDAVLRFRALSKRNADDAMTEDEVFTLFESLVGKVIVDELRTHAEFDIDLMTEIMKYVLEVYGVASSSPNPKAKREKVKA